MPAVEYARCDCCRSWHLVEIDADGIERIHCDWAKTHLVVGSYAWRKWLTKTGPTRASRESAVDRAMRRALRAASPPPPLMPRDWLM